MALRPRAIAGTVGRFTTFLRTQPFGLACVGIAAIVTLPNAEYPMIANGEYEYQSALIVAFRNHLHWGTQVIWTYGPLGWVNVLTFLDFRTWLLALAMNLLAQVVFFAALVFFLHRIRARWWLWLTVAVAVLVFFERYQNQAIGFDFERFPVVDHKVAMSAVLLLYLAADSKSERVSMVLSGAAGILLAYLVLDKGTSVLVAAGLIVAFLILTLNSRNLMAAAVLVASTVVVFLISWVLIGQPVSTIPSYFSSSYQLIAGYVGAMSWSNDTDQNGPLQTVIGVAVLVAGAVSLLIAALRRDRQLAGVLLLAAPVAYLSFKNSFVRFDEIHGLTFWSLAAMLLTFGWAVAMTNPGDRTRAAVAGLCGAAVLVEAVMVLGAGVALGQSPDLRPTVTFPDNLLSYRHAAGVITKPARRAEELDAVRQNLRNAYPLPPEVVAELQSGTVDIVPWDIQLAFAYDLAWDPQPVLQSYAAYRPYLDQADADHFNGATAPQFVVFAAHTIDNRYPLFDEPAAYRALMQHYTVHDVLPNMLVLKHVARTGAVRDVPASQTSGWLNHWIDVPTHGDQRLYARVTVPYSMLGQAAALLASPPVLFIRFKYAGGQRSPDYRFVAGNATDGLDMSSYAPDLQSIAGLADGQFSQPIEAFEIVADDPSNAYTQDIAVRYFLEPVS